MRKWNTKTHCIFRHQKYLVEVLEMVVRKMRKIWWTSPFGRNYDFSVLIVSSPGSQVSAWLKHCFTPNLQPYSICVTSRSTRGPFLFTFLPWAISWQQALQRGQVDNCGNWNMLGEFYIQAGILFLAHITNFLECPKGFLCIHIFHPSSCPTLHS